ncbi:helix-turn-helix transcriptional regulator [Shivajiella indica]|uniref:Helix-turn-helix transcriptional regulator n=1 Tax=Shivajiella indica TaxID=872115 RepID=A0ABW5B6R6_9BACT
MKIKNASPNNVLRDIVKEYYFIHLDAKSKTKQIPIIDDCSYDLIFFKEAKAIFVCDTIPKNILINEKIFTIHNLKPPFKIRFDKTLTFFTIKLQPWVNGYFFSHLMGRGIINLESLDEKLLEFYRDVFKKENIEKIFMIADELMLHKNFDLSNSMVLVKSICQYIEEKKGIITVNELGEHFNKSRQYLNKIFKREVLYSLKYFITASRILSLVKYKSKNSDISLTTICYEYGYFDQPHFIADFKKVCGVTPTQFFNNLPEFLLRH